MAKADETPTPIRVIRKNVLGATQKEFAAIAGVSQASVSRWEDGSLFPDAVEMARIRAFAKESGKVWSDSWFFEPPDVSQPASMPPLTREAAQ